MKIDEREAAGLTVELHADEDAVNPLTDFDHVWELIGGSGCPCTLDVNDRYADFSDPDYISHYRKPGDVVAILRGSDGYRLSIDRATCLEDANAIAVITREKIAEEWGGDIAAAYRCLDGILETQNLWLSGEVYGYVVEGDGIPSDLLDSCWGFYGESDVWSAGEDAARYVRSEMDRRALLRGLEQMAYPHAA